jgi:Zn-finger nucleic acid-binding protein
MSDFDLKRTRVPCPGCGLGLVALTELDAVFGGCTRCGGMWLNNVAGKMLMDGALSVAARDFARQVSARTPAATDAGAYRSAARGARSCPVCEGPLTPTTLPARTIEIDVCAAHGAYLDGSEIGAIWAETTVLAAERSIAEDARIAAEQRRMKMDAAFASFDFCLGAE